MKLRERFKKKDKAIWGIILVLVFYFSGAFLMEPVNVEPLAEKGLASDDYDNENSLMEIKGIGTILTYRNVYLASIPMLLIAPIIGILLYKKGEITNSNNDEQIGWIIFGNCILGLLLLPLTSKGNIPSTVLFWLGIIAATFLKKPNKENNL